MTKLIPRPIQVEPRYQLQNAAIAIRDVYDAVIELVTNVDDRYVLLNCSGKIEIELNRGHRKKTLRVRDFADGMTSDDMDLKLARRGGRVSGLEAGKKVRGTNSRGAKDIAVLGSVTFESIAHDGKFHKCQIRQAEFQPYESEKVTSVVRKRLGIPNGTGTMVTVELGREHTVPRHDSMVDGVARLVALRDILADPNRKVLIRDLRQDREIELSPPHIEGQERKSQRLTIPGYPGATAKLKLFRAKTPFEREPMKERLGGVLVKSKHAVHESTLFDPKLERDPHALWFYGKLTCEYLDDLWNDYDDHIERGEEIDPLNPRPVIDPMRRQGLTRDHPFVKALYGEALKVLRPLVDEERKRAEGERSRVESQQTRQRLDKLEKVAAKFMEEKQDSDEPSRDPDSTDSTRRLQERGYSLSPPFLQLVLGKRRNCWLNVRLDAFPELQQGSDVQVECLSNEISSSARTIGLEPHPTQEGVLRAVWQITALETTSATGIRVRAGSIVAEITAEVLEKESDRFRHVIGLQFGRKRYQLRGDKTKKRVTLMAPLSLVSGDCPVEVECSSRSFTVRGAKVIKPVKALGIARCELRVESKNADTHGIITAIVAGEKATAELISVPAQGSSIDIKLEDVDLVNQRYRWRSNCLEVAARHPSLQRYLGSKADKFPGQEQQHFCVLIAEIVADAVCSKVIERRELACAYEDEARDWSFFYAEFSQLMTEFLPIAHKLVVPDVTT